MKTKNKSCIATMKHSAKVSNPQGEKEMVLVSTLSHCWSCSRGRGSCSYNCSICCFRLAISKSLQAIALLITLLLSRMSITITLLHIGLLGNALLLSISSSLVTISCSMGLLLLLLLVTSIIALLTVTIACYVSAMAPTGAICCAQFNILISHLYKLK